MAVRFRTLLTPQVSNDEDRTRITTLLNAIIICGIAVVLLNLAVRLIFAPETFVFSWVSGATLGLLGGLWLLIRRGYVQVVSAGLSAGIWLLVTIAVLNFGTGIFAPSFAFYT